MARRLTPFELANYSRKPPADDPGRNDRAFLRFLLDDPPQIENYMGDARSGDFFCEPRNWLIFKFMEKVYIEQGTITLDTVGEELAARDLLDIVGGALHLEHIVQHHVPEWLWKKPNYQNWRAGHKE